MSEGRLVSQNAPTASGLERWEWLFPLRGRWLRTFLISTGYLSLVLYLVGGLAVAQFVPHLLSARGLRVSVARNWSLREEHGNWDRTGCPFVLSLGPVRYEFRYPARGKRHAGELPLQQLLVCGLIGLPLLIAKCRVKPKQFSCFAWCLGATACFLLFPLAAVCGPMGCQAIQPWHVIYYGLLNLIRG